ncbi:MAG: hypothetical protein AAF244_01380 [Pseudomonadota bacterium]
MTNESSKNKSEEINNNFDKASQEEEDKFSVTFDGPIMPTKKIEN